MIFCPLGVSLLVSLSLVKTTTLSVFWPSEDLKGGRPSPSRLVGTQSKKFLPDRLLAAFQCFITFSSVENSSAKMYKLDIFEWLILLS